MTIEGVVADGQIKLEGDVRLPDNTRVYVVVPDVQVVDIQLERVVHIYSPRLLHREDAKDFELEITEEPAGLRPFGLAEGEFVVPDDFDAPLPESVTAEFEGKRIDR